MIFYSPLRYPGGKGKIADFFYATFEANNLCDGTYVEPYAGGASVALSLLVNEYVSNVIINDIDRSIYAFWKSVLFFNDEFCDLISKTKVNLKTWKKCKETQNNKRSSALLDLGFSTFFLNRTNHSGIINGGVIGGKNQEGKWKIDARYNKEDLINRIKRIGEYRDRVRIYNQDASKLLRQLSQGLDSNTLCYFDPPYYEKGKDLYVNYYNDADHKKMARAIKGIERIRWVVSYDNKIEIKDMYQGSKYCEYSLNYSAADTRLGSEVMFFSDNLNISERMLNALNRT